MPDRVSIVLQLILDRPTCVDCLVAKSGMTAPGVEAALDVIADALMVYREPDRCRVCGETKEVASVKRRGP